MDGSPLLFEMEAMVFDFEGYSKIKLGERKRLHERPYFRQRWHDRRDGSTSQRFLDLRHVLQAVFLDCWKTNENDDIFSYWKKSKYKYEK